MARKKSSTLQEVNAIRQQSEGRNRPVSNAPGHVRKYHAGVDGLQISDRPSNTLTSDAAHPMVMTPGGAIAAQSTHRDIWKARNPGMPSRETQAYHRSNSDNHTSRSGSFIDRQRAISVARFMLNSATGQAKLQALDGGEARVPLNLSLNQLDLTTRDGNKMYFASHSGGTSDITHLEDFSNAFMLIDRIEAGGIHIQTLYPIR